MAGLRAAAGGVQGALHGGQVGQHQLGVDGFGVVGRIDRARHVRDAPGFEAAQHVHRRVGLAHLGEEAVAQALAARRALHQAGHVHQLQRGVHLAPHAGRGGHGVQARIGDGHPRHVRVDGAEGAVVGGDRGGGQRVEERGLADVRQPEDRGLHPALPPSAPVWSWVMAGCIPFIYRAPMASRAPCMAPAMAFSSLAVGLDST